MRFAAIIVAAGRGTRAGAGLPKQYRALAGRPVLAHTLAAFAGHPGLGALIVVHHPDDHAALAAIAPGFAGLVAVPGGAERAASVRAGLAAVPDDCAAVLIHDAARPLVSRRVIDGVLEALATHPAAAPAVAVTDALWRGAGGQVAATVPREGLYRAQTPQGFHTAAIRAAHAGHGADAADDVEVARAAGLDVAIVEGDETNLKITRAEDFARAEQLMRTRAMKDIRTGTGFDVHAFAEGDAVVLCGVRVPHTRALSGHSDADVGMHALTDAIYGALAEGDIGQHFPPSDMRWKGAASHIFLEHAVARVAARGFVLSNADITLICEYPKIGPHSGAMRAALAGLLGVEEGRVSVKATTSERLGFTGREEGIAALATVTLIAP